MISFHILRMIKRLNYADKQSVYILKKEQSTQCLDSQRTNEMIKKKTKAAVTVVTQAEERRTSHRHIIQLTWLK